MSRTDLFQRTGVAGAPGAPRLFALLAFGGLLSAAAVLAACGPAESVQPVGAGTTTTTETTTTTTTETTTVPDGSPPKRTVSLRNPLAGPPNNLLFDGDFELSTSYGTGQYGWRMFNASGTGETAMTVETGGLCRSGLTCIKVHKGQILLGRGTAAANGKSHVMEVFFHMPEGVACNKITVIALECDTFAAIKQSKADMQPTDGWCRSATTFKSSTVAVCMYIQTSLGADDEALLDSAVLAPNDGTVPLKETAFEPLDEATLGRLSNLRDYVRRTTQFGRPPITGPARPD